MSHIHTCNGFVINKFKKLKSKALYMLICIVPNCQLRNILSKICMTKTIVIHIFAMQTVISQHMPDQQNTYIVLNVNKYVLYM